MSAYRDFLKLLAFSDEEIPQLLPQWENACRLLELSEEELDYAANSWLPRYWDLSLLGVRKCIGAYFRELIRLTEISMQGNSILYNVYYFSSNIDHFLHNEPNAHSKTLLAKSFSANYIWDPKGFAEFFVFDDNATKCEEFLDSWCEVKTEGNSIKCGTNINILMKDLLRQVK